MQRDIVSHDPITANTIYRTGASTTLIQIFESAENEDVAVLAVWCLSRISRNPEIAKGLLQQNLGKLLVLHGLKKSQKIARMSAWCFGTLICADNIAEMLAQAGFLPALCEHLRKCTGGSTTEWETVTAEDCCAALYAVARISRAIKIAKGLSKGGCVDALARLLLTSTDAQVLMWTARAVGCLMRPNSTDIARALLDAGVAGGLARLPSVLKPEEVEPLGAFAFAIQRFSCAEWGGGTRKVLVDAGSVDALLAALRTASAEPYPQVHIELAYAIALLSDVGGTSIRKEIVNAGGIVILKQVGSQSARTDVQKACNLAVTSVTGGIWSRNAASAKAAYVHEWSGGCPEFYPGCPVVVADL
ncbi:armadillo-type protein [Mycena amicta]|nr:armadillo-type protein [Mycena amicta]